MTLRANTDITSSDAPVSEGYVILKEKLESVYSCLGISCSQVGGLIVGDGPDYYDGFEPCSDGDSGGVEGWAVAVGVIAAVSIVGVALFIGLKRRKQKKSAQAMESDLGGFGAKPSTTI